MSFTPIKHEGDCGGTKCPACGCCMHSTQASACGLFGSMSGVECPESGCGCVA